MILTSPSEDAGQTPPVTTTFDAPAPGRVASLASRRTPVPVRWQRVERLHHFVRARALERLRAAEASGDTEARRAHRRNLDAIDAMFKQARRGRDGQDGQAGENVMVACAITFFRARAMRDAQHPDFLGEWLGRAETRSA